MTQDKIRLFATVSALAVTLGLAGVAHADSAITKGQDTQAAANNLSSALAADQGSIAAGGDVLNEITTVPINITNDSSTHDNLTLVTKAKLEANVTGNRVAVGNGATNKATEASTRAVSVNRGEANGGHAHSGSAEGGDGGDGGDASSGHNASIGVAIAGYSAKGSETNSKARGGDGGSGGGGGTTTATGGNGGSIDQQADAQAQTQADSHNTQNIALATGSAAANAQGVQGITPISVNSGINSSVNNQVTVSAVVGSVLGSGSIMRSH